MVRKADTAREKEINDMKNRDSKKETEILENEKFHKSGDLVIPVIIVKEEDADSGTESVAENKDSLILNVKTGVSDITVPLIMRGKT